MSEFLDDRGLIAEDIKKMITDPEFLLRFAVTMVIILAVIGIVIHLIKKLKK